MTQFQYTAYVRLGSGDSNCIYTDVTIELSEEEIEKLNSLKSSYQGKPHRISQEVQHQYPGLHHKLMKEAHDDVECLLVRNAVENGYSEVYEEDLYAQDCDEGRFSPTEDEEENTAINRWRKEETDHIESMSSKEQTAYLSKRYIIELDFDENDYDYKL